MKVRAPGKLLLSGAYAVLEGAPAIVVAVDRYAIADDAREATTPSHEVRAAFGARAAPHVDASALHDEAGHKLGLGSSAAVLVASLATRAAREGALLDDAATRRRLFDEACAAHAMAQGGGSGVDVAASVHGGALRFQRGPGGARMDAVELPRGLVMSVSWSGKSARTSELRARVDALRARDAARYAACFAALTRAAIASSDAVATHDLAALLSAARVGAAALAALGSAADAPIVPPAFAELAAVAELHGAVFFPSGAGGGDVGVHLGAAPPSAPFLACADKLGMHPLAIAIDRGGVQLLALPH